MSDTVLIDYNHTVEMLTKLPAGANITPSAPICLLVTTMESWRKVRFAGRLNNSKLKHYYFKKGEQNM